MLFRAALVVVLAGSCLAQDPKRLDQIVGSYVADHKFMGTVLVARGSNVLFSKGYGSANLGWDIPNTPNTKFRIGSITKQFTAASILLLEERGKLSVNATVKTYLPDAPVAWDKITIFHLLTHTSGIPDYSDFREYEQFAALPTTASALVSRFRDKPLEFQPGEKEAYSNSGYVLLTYIIEKLSGGSYGAFVQDNFFAPLGMKDSGYDSNSAIVPRLASGYVPRNGGFENAGFLHPSVYQGAGAIYSTTADLLRWEEALFGGKVLTPASLEKMTTPFKNNYALGLEVTTFRGLKIVNHSGRIKGFATELEYYPADKLTIAVLGNVNPAPTAQIARQLARLAHGETVTLQSERRETAIDPKVLARYAGAYQLSAGGKLLITVEDNHLVSTAQGQAPVSFFPESETVFFRKDADVQIEFPIEAGESPARQFTLNQAEKDTTAKRLDEAEFRRLSDAATATAKRYREQKPFPGSEAAVRKLVDDLRAGKADDSMMHPSLAAAIHKQLEQLHTLVAGQGVILSVAFQGVGPAGADRYLVKGEHGSLECQISLAPDGKMTGVNFRRVP